MLRSATYTMDWEQMDDQMDHSFGALIPNEEEVEIWGITPADAVACLTIRDEQWRDPVIQNEDRILRDRTKQKPFFNGPVYECFGTRQ